MGDDDVSEPWRVGPPLSTVYDGDRPVCHCYNPEDATRIVEALNRMSEFKRIHDECHQQRDLARAEFARLHSWEGLMSLLDEHYPADIFIDDSGDLGPRVVVLIRECDVLRYSVRTLKMEAESLRNVFMSALREMAEETGSEVPAWLEAI
jgi:hypothetical protein